MEKIIHLENEVIPHAKEQGIFVGKNDGQTDQISTHVLDATYKQGTGVYYTDWNKNWCSGIAKDREVCYFIKHHKRAKNCNCTNKKILKK